MIDDIMHVYGSYGRNIYLSYVIYYTYAPVVILLYLYCWCYTISIFSSNSTGVMLLVFF